MAAGLSSSSALLTSFTLALLQVNGVTAGFEDLMEILPEGERFVGTRGGGMDHAAVLASRLGCALLVNFAPVSVRPVPIPSTWSFLVAHSLIRAEKSGAVRAEYNARRSAGRSALERLGFASYAAVIEHGTPEELNRLAGERLSGLELRSFLHVIGEAQRVRDAVAALRNGDAPAFGRLLSASHASLRDLLRVSSAELDTLVDVAREAGALGARLTGAGFGGCAVILCSAASRERVRAEIIHHYYSGRAGFDAGMHLIDTVPSAGALFG
jgi:galactokinase